MRTIRRERIRSPGLNLACRKKDEEANRALVDRGRRRRGLEVRLLEAMTLAEPHSWGKAPAWDAFPAWRNLRRRDEGSG
jgi:hypothetical protein